MSSLLSSFMYTSPAAYKDDLASFEVPSAATNTAATAPDSGADTVSFCGSCGRGREVPPTADDHARRIFAKIRLTYGWRTEAERSEMSHDEAVLELEICDQSLELLIKGQDAMLDALAAVYTVNETANRPSDVSAGRKSAAEQWVLAFYKWRGRRVRMAFLLKSWGRVYMLPERHADNDEAALRKVRGILSEGAEQREVKEV